jgi:hypothetical protein
MAVTGKHRASQSMKQILRGENMSDLRIKPVLVWQEHWLLWDYLPLVLLEKIERNGKQYFILKHPVFIGAFNEYGFHDVEILWEDEEFCEGDFDFYMTDNGNVHDRVKEMYEQIISDLPYELLQQPQSQMSGVTRFIRCLWSLFFKK